MNRDFTDWMDRATRGLPPELISLIGEELACHYEDAVEDYVRRGYTIADAQNAAVADLGDPKMTAQEFRLTHTPRSRYVKAAVASIAPGIPMFILVFMAGVPENKPIAQFIMTMILLSFSMVTLICLHYVLMTFRVLLGIGFHMRFPVRLIIGGMAVLNIFALYSLEYEQPNGIGVFIPINDPVVFGDEVMPIRTLPYIYELTLAFFVNLVGIGWVLFGKRLDYIHRDQLYGLMPFVRWLFIFSGLFLLGAALSIVIRAPFGIIIIGTFSGIIGTVKAALRDDPSMPLAA